MKVLQFLLALLISCNVLAASPTVPAANVITSTTSCVLPACAVFFDASGTTDADLPDVSLNKNRAFRELEYVWSFGNTGSWTNTPFGAAVGASRWSKNIAFGPIAATVYDTPGTKQWRLRVCDGTSCVTRTGTVVVSNWVDATHGATLCVANGSTPVPGVGGCPADATAVLNTDTVSPVDDYKTFMTTAFGPNGCGSGVTCMRVLLRKGDTFVSGSQWTWGDYSNRVIASYGSGSMPLVSHGNFHVNAITTQSAPTKIVGIHYQGSTVGGDNGSGLCVYVFGANSRVILHQSRCNSTGGGVSISSGANLTRSFITDNWFHDCRARNNFFGLIDTSAVIGNMVGPNQNPSTPSVGTSSCEHGMRFQGARKVVISNNTILDPSDDKTHLTIRAGDHSTGASDDANFDTQYVVVSNNKFIARRQANISRQFLQIAPSGNTQCQWGYDFVVERNWFLQESSNTNSINSIGTAWSRLAIRNNLATSFGATSGLNFIAVSNGQYKPHTVTITEANPAVVTFSQSTDDISPTLRVYFTTTGTLPTNISGLPQVYYIRNYNAGAKTFNISLTDTGPLINSSGAIQSGTHKMSQQCVDTGGTVDPTNAVPNPSHIYMYNNTIYQKGTVVDSTPVSISGAADSSGNARPVTHFVGKNNLTYVPNTTNRTLSPYVIGDYTTGFDWSRTQNTADSWNLGGTADAAHETKLLNPQFRRLPTDEVGIDAFDFTPSAASGYPQSGRGTSVGVSAMYDFEGCVNKNQSVFRLGAFENRSAAVCLSVK